MREYNDEYFISTEFFFLVVGAVSATLGGFREFGEHLVLNRPLLQLQFRQPVGISHDAGEGAVLNDILNGSHDAQCPWVVLRR